MSRVGFKRWFQDNEDSLLVERTLPSLEKRPDKVIEIQLESDESSDESLLLPTSTPDDTIQSSMSGAETGLQIEHIKVDVAAPSKEKSPAGRVTFAERTIPLLEKRPDQVIEVSAQLESDESLLLPNVTTSTPDDTIQSFMSGAETSLQIGHIEVNVAAPSKEKSPAGRVTFAEDLKTDVAPAVDPAVEEQQPAMNTAEIQAILEWFREKLSAVASVNDYVTPADMKRAMENDPTEFAEKLFTLVDTDKSGSISQQELIGGLSRLTVKEKKKIMKWFEDIFTATSGEDQLLQLDEFEKALQTKGFVEKLFQLMDHSGSGKLTVPKIVDALGKLPCMGKDANWLSWVENQFSDLAGSDRQIDFEEFKSALQLSKSSFFVKRFFEIFDEDNSGTISLSEMMNALTLLLQGSRIEKLRFLFKVYDVDGNGTIDYEELKTVLKSCMDESALTFSEESLEELATALFEDADADKSGAVSFDELQEELEKYPDIVENLTISAANWLKPQRRPRKKKITERLPTWMTLKHFENNWSYFVFLALFFVINIILFVEAAVRHRDAGVFVSIARGGGACLNFTPVVVLVLMFRQIITLIRSTPIAILFPLNKYIKLHKIVGYTILFFTIVHFLAHIANFSYLEVQRNNRDNESNDTAPACDHPMWYCLFAVNTGIGWVGGAASLTGFLLLIILIIMVVCSLPIVRRKGKFQVFYWSHNLFVIWYIILILHGRHFWKWFIGPALIYIVERIFRSKVIKFIRYGPTYIQTANVLSSKVTHLSITRPHNFSYQPGDYVFIQIPVIARYEWHPFTISSAPELKDVFWLHIRGVGSWTNKLYEYFDSMNKNENTNNDVQVGRRGGTVVGRNKSERKEVKRGLRRSISETKPVKSLTRLGAYFQSFFKKDTDSRVQVHIDGPYGTPSAHIFQAEHAVLIGCGIGVTPFASILQSIVNRFKHSKQTCPSCQHSWTGSLPQAVMKLKKVDFFWINRHQKHFEWFVHLLSELEIEQFEEGAAMDRFLDMHMYITSALQKTDVKAIMLQMALDLIHKEKNVDLITGLKTRTQPGRPNWDKVFKELHENRRGNVTVFFCGSPVIARILSQQCEKYNFHFRKENF